MPLVAYFVGLSLSELLASISFLSVTYLGVTKMSELDNDTSFVDALNTHETVKKDTIAEEANTELSNLDTFITTDTPVIEAFKQVTTVSPVSMPDYLTQQNELLEIQIEATRNLTNQAKFQNDLLAKSVQSQIVGNANSKMVAETLASSLPALVLQMQQVAKIPASIKLSSEITTAYSEQGLVNHDALMTRLNELVYAVNTGSLANSSVALSQQSVASATQIIKDATVSQANELSKVVTNLDAVSESAKYQNTVAQIRDLEGNIIAELKPNELSTYKDITLAKAKEKEKEIADYQTTVGEITNLDGTVIASIKPMEATTIKNAVEAKNGTDEMEFEIPDDILDDVFQVIPLPTFTNYDYGKQTDFMFNGGSLDG